MLSHLKHTFSALFCFAVILFGVSASVYADDKIYLFSVVPQQSASKTAAIWNPVMAYLSEKVGVTFRLKTAKNIPTFEERLSEQEPDFSYMNPYHYVHFHKLSGYNAIVRARDRVIKGIIVVQKDSDIKTLEDLKGQELAYPSPAAFAASILPRGFLKQQGITTTAEYVSSHDSVYLNVARKRFVAGGGIGRTLDNATPEVRDQLRILWTSKGYTPHAIATHKRVPEKLIRAVQKALIELSESSEGLEMLEAMKLTGFISAKDSDWNDVRALKLDEL